MELLVIFRNIEVDGPVALISVSCIQDFLYGFDLLDDMSRCTRLDGWRCNIEHPHGLMVAEGIGLYNFHWLKLFQPGLLCNLVLSFVRIMLEVTYVCDVAHIADLVSEMLEEFEKDVVCHARSCMSEMGIAIDCRSADIHAHVTRVNRNEEFLFV